MSHHHHDDHDDHGHEHTHDHGHDHDDHGDPSAQEYQLTPEKLLYEQIDFPKVSTLNEEEPRSGEAILKKTWAQRLDAEPCLESDADEQLLMHVPFTGQVRLQSILIRSSDSESAPATLKLYINRDDLDFTTAEDLPPTQSFELARANDVQEYAVKRALFNNTRSLTLFFSHNFSSAYGDGDDEVTRLWYVAFKGEYMKLSKEPVSFLYEAAANPADHKQIVGEARGVGSGIGGSGDGL